MTGGHRYPDEWVEALAKLHAEQDGEDWDEPSVYGHADVGKFYDDYRATAVAFLDLVEPLIRYDVAERIAVALATAEPAVKEAHWYAALDRAADIAREHGRAAT